MIDIKSELLALKKKRKQDFISVIELLDFLKEHNSTTDYSEIATYLLIKLEPHDIRKTDDDLWGNEAFNVWESEHGIKTYLMPDSISDKPQAVDTSYFLTALEVVREDKNLLLFDDNAKAIDYLDEHQKNIFVDRKQIEFILNINTLDEKALNNKYQNKITVAVGMALTKTDEFIKNTDINKSPVGLAERLVMQQQIAELQNRIAELEKEIESLKKSDIESSKYNPTERETHLQAIAILALRYAEQNESRLMTDTGKIKKSSIAKILKDESAELFTTPKSAETFRPRIAEAIKFYSQEAE
ncbi:hypothetical protein [Pasteurella canis]|uniref:hypothetical protein n=1 Tax=Pasteurella canis TaxID=753 RepID=UPI001328B973|nr:hypothetical protein [Pasteurella canis]MXN89023.1 hypothetical protein [Pasteurella canis]